MKKLTVLFVLLLSCSGKSDEPREAPTPPTAVDPVAAMNVEPQMSVTGTDVKENPKVRPLTPTDEVNCSTMCGQLAYCNQKAYQKATSATAISACVKGCTARRGEADRGRWEAMETCMKQHGGEECTKLRACIETAISELQKRLHGMEAPAPTPPKPDPIMTETRGTGPGTPEVPMTAAAPEVNP